MPDNRNQRGSPDDQRINVNDEDEIRNWSKSMNATPEELDAREIEGGSKEGRLRRCG